MTKTQILNLIYGIVCALAALGSETGTLPLPDAWKHKITMAALAALWLKGHWNYFTNPDGTSARVAYDAPLQSEKSKGASAGG